MTESDQSGSGNGNGDGGASARERVQVQLILDSMPNVAAYPPDWETRPEGADYLYRTDSIIVRDANLNRVRRIVNPQEAQRNLGDEEAQQVREQVPQVTLPGSTRLDLPAARDVDAASVHSVLRDIEAVEGPHVAGLDHLFYVCVHSCAAIEPEPALANADPVPLPQTAVRSNHGLGVRVEVFDTGLLEDAAARHDWMAGVTGDVEDPLDAHQRIRQDAGHGTFAAGCVRATAPAAGVHVVDASRLPGRDSGSAGIGAIFESELAELLHRRLVAPEDSDQPVEVPDVLVLNFAGTTHNGAPPVALAALYDSVIQHLKELVIIAPAGNEGDKRKNWPASFAWVVSVGALDENQRRIASWSNRGRSIDVYAPGDRLVNAFATGKYKPTWDGQDNPEIEFEGMATWSGTSFATPLVAGLVASRMSTTMQSSRRAWESLLTQAERNSLPGVGPVLFPGQELG